ncbi:rho GDP-dissociation inhibitor 1-like isoform X2 [Impatiens glandulifera]|uniref:rho GDP-dissociation inhibitor 1-like isoform X2 n=1 Tax=Impatiens glandulifera TaxID=253017 RepID=UPI001FB1447A|nr:rho GDP-dissociation inhibitor 1-like isoform X2 [Impatiens glandulifera]
MESAKKAVAGPSCGIPPNGDGGGYGSEAEHEKDRAEIAAKAGENREDELDDDEHACIGTTFDEFVPSPLIPLKAALEKDKDDESLRRWKEKLLGRVESDLTEQMEPEVTFLTIGIISDELGEINTPLPVDETKSRDVLFALRENSEYQLKLTFTVGHNIVSGLAYTNTVWRYGVQVRRRRQEMSHGAEILL